MDSKEKKIENDKNPHPMDSKEKKIENDKDYIKSKCKSMKEERENQETAWNDMCCALGISKKDMSEIQMQGIVRSLVNMLYLVVIVGCELDLYGFVMAYPTYWCMGFDILKVLLVVGPVGYFLAVIMYLYYSNKRKQEDDNNTQQEDDNKDSEGQVVGLRSTRNPIDLEYYHFLPVFRYYLVIKDKTKSDVEGIFRVNSLSSFTLGISQIISIVFQLFVAENPMTIFVKINICSQIINWIITILYFVTPISEMMASSIEISALTSNSKDQIRGLKKGYMAATIEGAQATPSKGAHSGNFSKAENTGNFIKAENITRFVDLEIAHVGLRYGSRYVDLEQFSIELKFKALRLLREKQLNGYSNIS